jgi:hypothetical protein
VKDDVIGGALWSSWEDENCTQNSGCIKKSGRLVDLAGSE